MTDVIVATLDGYDIWERELEGVKFSVEVEPISWDEVKVIKITPAEDARDYLAKFNMARIESDIKSHYESSAYEVFEEMELDEFVKFLDLWGPPSWMPETQVAAIKAELELA
jgi:hypothetical protein